MKAVVDEPLICPRCGVRPQTTPSGFCAPCVIERAAEQYAAEDHRRAVHRGERFTESSDRLAQLRQQRRRLVEMIRPRRPAESFDPWAIAEAGLRRLQQVRIARRPVSPEILDDIAESIRRLAWGPDDGATVVVERRHKGRRQIPGQLTLWPLEEAIAA